MLKKPQKPRDATESLCLPKIKKNMPTRTNSVEMNKIVTNSEIDLHYCLCKSTGLKLEEAATRGVQLKRCS